MHRERNSTTVRFPLPLRLAGGLLRLLARLAPPAAAIGLARLFTTVPRAPLPERERGWLADAASRRARIAGREIVLRVWGEGSATVLLVHGWGGRGSQLGAFVAPLTARDFRVVAFDAAAHGAAPGRRTNLVELTATVEALMRRFRPRLLVAHSAGAVASTLALHRLGGGVGAERAVFLAPSDDAGCFLPELGRRLGLPPSIAERAIRRFERQLGWPWQSFVASRTAPQLSVPLLVVHDAQDREVPLAHGLALAAAWPGARLEVTRGLGHTRILRHATVVARAVEFLATDDGLRAELASARMRDAGEGAPADPDPAYSTVTDCSSTGTTHWPTHSMA